MELLIFGLVLGFFFALVFFVHETLGKAKQKKEVLPYKLRLNVFNKSEEAFFLELQRQLPQGFYVFPKMRIIDFIDPNSSDWKWRNKIWAKHVDFLICNSQFEPILAIELNGDSHLSPDRAYRDRFVGDILKTVKLSLEEVKVRSEFSEVVSRIVYHLSHKYGKL